jgi:hypothetical protein
MCKSVFETPKACSKPECRDFLKVMSVQILILVLIRDKRFCLILDFINLVLKLFVMQQIVINPSLAYRAISSMYKEGKNCKI